MVNPIKYLKSIPGQTCYLVAAAFFGVGLFVHWFLFFAFLCILPPLHADVEKLRDQIARASPIDLPPSKPGAESEPTFATRSVVKVSSETRRSSAPSPGDSATAEDATVVSAAPRKMAPWGSPTLRIRDLHGNILEVNSAEPVPYESEYFKGKILTMVRCEGGRWEKHFAGKQRKFEVQIQGKMKQLPTGNVMLGGELQEKVEFGLVTRTLINILMRFTAKLLPSMRYSLGEAYSADGKYECPHIASPLFRTMDRVWVTPEGEEPPELGTELPEPDSERNLRRSGKAPYADMKFEMGKTYSFSFHSMYLDFGNWVITNVPGYSGLDLKTIVENQSVSVVCYDVPFDPPGKTLRHYANVKKYLTYMEYQHISTIPDCELKEYNDFMANPVPEDEPAEVETSPTSDIALANGDYYPNVPDSVSHIVRSHVSTPAGEVAGRDDDSSGNENEDDALTDVPSNSFVPITLLHEDSENSIPASLSNNSKPLQMQYENPVWPGVGGKNGFAVVREFQDVQNLKFIKLSAPAAPVSKPRSSMRMWPVISKKAKTETATTALISDSAGGDGSEESDKFWHHDHKSGEKLRNGDIILVQSATTGEYLTIQRGWWLVWTSRTPQNRKGHFIITMMDHEEKVRNDSSPLYVGFPFRLRSARWPTWQVGLQQTASSAYGGKLLTLYHPPKSNGDRHASIDMSSFTKSMATDAYSMPKYSSKSVRPLVLSVLPESVCERYSRETVGMIRAVMSTRSVFRDPNLRNRPTPLASMKGDDVDIAPPLSDSSPYMHSSRISLPLSTGRESIGFKDYWGLPEDGMCLSISSQSKKYDTLSYRYFPRSMMNVADIGAVFFELTGWVEVMNRDTMKMQLAYLLACEIPDVEHSEDNDIGEIGSDSEHNPRVIFSPSKSSISSAGGCKRARRFTVLRTGAQIFEKINATNSIQGSAAMKESFEQLTATPAPYPLMRNISTKSNDVSSLLGEPDLDRTMSESVSVLCDGDDTKSDSSDEPGWASNKNFGQQDFDKSASGSGGSHDARESPIGVICPRHQSDADHIYQLLAALISAALQQEDSIAAAVFENSAESVGKPKEPFNYPTRRYFLELAASPDDELTDFFVSDVAKAGPGSDEKKQPERRRSLSIHRNHAASMSSSDLVSQQVSPLLRTTVVARALWDCHWREEFVQLHASFISFFPLISPNVQSSHTAKPTATYPGGRRKHASKAFSNASAQSGPASLTLLLADVTNVSLMGEAFSKFPGYHILKLESLGRVTYLAFNSLSQCESFAGYVLELKSEAAIVGGDTGDLSSVDGVMGDPRDSFVLRSARWRPHSRMILNSRRFYFDIDQQRAESIITNVVCKKPWLISYPSNKTVGPDVANVSIPYWELSERLLRDVAFLSNSSQNEANKDENQSDGDRLKLMGTDRLMSFLDDVGALKLIDLISIDYSSREAVCFFSNIYHTLLLHARLVLGSPNAETWTTFFDTVTYEIGGDVFSILELEHCVLRGRLSRPEVLPKLGYKLPLADDDRYAYALSVVDRRINFVLCDGSMSGPNSIFVLAPETMEKQLQTASKAALEFSLDINTAKRSITLPRVCFLYRQDFLTADDKDEYLAVLNNCRQYFGKAQSSNIGNLLDSSKQEHKEVKVRFREPDFNSYSSLILQ